MELKKTLKMLIMCCIILIGMSNVAFAETLITDPGLVELSSGLQKKYQYEYPNNFVPENLASVTMGGVTVAITDNLVTVKGSPTFSTGHWYIYFSEKLVLPTGRYYIQLWDVTGDTEGLVGAVCNERRVLSNNMNGYSSFVLTEETEVSFGVDVYYNFKTETSFKMTVSSSLLSEYEPTHVPVAVSYEYVQSNNEDLGVVNNLYGKKWAICGDSFSCGDFKNAPVEDYILTDGKYAGHNKVYGYIIGNRNNMEIQNLALGGRTMATPADSYFTNAFSNEIYKTIDKDVDYITLYFGINDSHHRRNANASDGENQAGVIDLGTIEDKNINTFYGAWNVVMEYLITNYPDAHIGIIISNGCETDDYRKAEIEIAKKWGIPYIDLNGDKDTPMMIRSTNPDISAKAKDIRNKAWGVNWEDEDITKINKHPSAKAHEYQSIFIENWLRGL